MSAPTGLNSSATNAPELAESVATPQLCAAAGKARAIVEAVGAGAAVLLLGVLSLIGLTHRVDQGVEHRAGVVRSNAMDLAVIGAAPVIFAAGICSVAVYGRRRALAEAERVRGIHAALAGEEKRARALIEGSDLILWEYLPSKGAFTYVSPQAERLGYPLAEWAKPGFWEDHLHPEDRDGAVAFCREQTMLGEDHRLHYRMVKPDGSCVWIDDVVAVSRTSGGATVLRGAFLDITERKEAEAKANEVHARLQKIASQVPGMVYQFKLRPDGTSCLPYASDGIRDIFRVEAAEVRADATVVFNLIHPEDRVALDRSIEDSARELAPWRTEYRVRFPDGKVRWLHGNAVPQREADGSILWHGFITDITDRKEAEHDLLAANKRFELARRSIRLGVWEWDIRDNGLTWDDSMYELYDVEDRAPGANAVAWGKRVHPDDLERVNTEIARALQGSTDFDTRFRVVHRDGALLWLAAHGVVVRDSAGNPVRLVGLNIDITRQVNTQDTLARARDQAEAANRAKSEFLANMSHEIRTPLTAILGYADLLRDDGDASRWPPQRIELVETIRTAGRHLLDVISDILDLSKIEAGKMSVERMPVNLPEIVAEVETLLRPRAAAKQIALSVRLDTSVPDLVISDPTRLRQILVNLAGNAIKFTETGEVSIRIAAGRRLRFEVEDTGVGITAPQARRLFEPFAQADSTVTRRHGGTGLGLVICRRLAHLMSGEVALLRTTPGVGSVFRLDLPLQRAPGCVELTALGVPKAPERHVAPKLASLAGRVLLVEDGIDNQRLIAFYLKRAGATVEVAENGQVALDVFERAIASGNPFDLIVTDVQMPIMDGCTLAQSLRERGHAIPIVALTAHAMAEDRDRCFAAGCNGYATKPIDAAALLKLCAGLVADEPSGAAA